MNLLPVSEAYIGLREGALWSLLAADSGPLVLAIFSTTFTSAERTVPYSVLHERVDVSLEQLREQGHHLPQSTKDYIASWKDRGWLRRQLLSQDSEEQFSLTTEAHQALRFVTTLLQPRNSATESRLAIVIQQMLQLADATDPQPHSRLSALEAERNRIEAEIENVKSGQIQVLEPERALERAKEILSQAEDLTQDFHLVREAFVQLNHKMRQRLLEEEGTRSEVLESIFAGLDVIADSEAGRSFNAFWRLLTDRVQVSALEAAIEAVTSRQFAKELPPADRRFLQDLTQTLLAEAAGVHSVIHVLSAGLKKFVQSNEYGQNRRLNDLIREAQSAALGIKDDVSARTTTPFSYENSVAQVRSVAQLQLKDPSFELTSSEMVEVAPSTLSLDQVAEMVKHSDIDFRALHATLRIALETDKAIGLPALLKAYPVSQGFGSVMGYISMGAKSGLVDRSVTEVIEWHGMDGTLRRARVPKIVFEKEKFNV